jgi:hypothetical protein
MLLNPNPHNHSCDRPAFYKRLPNFSNSKTVAVLWYYDTITTVRVYGSASLKCPDPTLQWNADPDPDPAPHQSVFGPPWLHFLESLKLLNFDLLLIRIRFQHFTLMRIWNRNPALD